MTGETKVIDDKDTLTIQESEVVAGGTPALVAAGVFLARRYGPALIGGAAGLAAGCLALAALIYGIQQFLNVSFNFRTFLGCSWTLLFVGMVLMDRSRHRLCYLSGLLTNLFWIGQILTEDQTSYFPYVILLVSVVFTLNGYGAICIKSIR